MLVTGFGAVFLMVNIGLSSDARKPNFSWMSPNEVVKRGFPIMIVILGGMVLAFGGGAVSFVLSLTWASRRACSGTSASGRSACSAAARLPLTPAAPRAWRNASALHPALPAHVFAVNGD